MVRMYPHPIESIDLLLPWKMLEPAPMRAFDMDDETLPGLIRQGQPAPLV